jgi:hypothetical protein
MLDRAFKADVPCAWVTGDEVYGRDRHLRMWLEEQEQPFVLAVARNEPLWCNAGRGVRQERAADIAAGVASEAWQRLSCGAGAKGPRLYDWVRVRLSRLQEPPWDHWLLVRRSIAQPDDVAYYVVFGPETSTLPELVQVAGRRGRWKKASSRARGKSGWIGTKCGIGPVGTGISRWLCWHRHI